MADPVLHSPRNPHFLQPLLPGFHSYLEIPVKFFSAHIEGRKYRNTAVELKSDACERSWKVKMEGRRLTAGWKQFAEDHDFRIGDIVIFRYEGDLVFHVMGFGPSCCEIQYLQPCSNNGNDDDDDDENLSNRNMSTEQNPKTEAESSSCLVAKVDVTASSLQLNRLLVPQKFVRSDGVKEGSNKIVVMSEGSRRWTLKLIFMKRIGTFYMSGCWRRFCHENGLKPGDQVTFKLEANTETPILHFYTSEKKRGENRFVTLTATRSILKTSQLNLPMKFVRINGMEDASRKKITMLDKNGVEWTVSLQLREGNTRMRLCSGLRGFFKANDIKAYDSFVLELVWEDATTPILKFCSKIINN